MRYMTGLLMTALVLSSTPSGAQTEASVACSLSVLLADPDPNGTNVRAAPGTRARVLAVIPYDASAVAEVREQRGAWFRVVRIFNAELDTDQRPGAELFRGEGWVHGSLLGLDVATEDPRLYAAPDRRSRVVATLVAAETATILVGCSGPWARVRAGGRVGWLSPGGQCSNPLTNCS